MLIDLQAPRNPPKSVELRAAGILKRMGSRESALFAFPFPLRSLPDPKQA